MEFAPKLVRLKVNGVLTGAVILKHPCKDCGEPDAPFGSGVFLLKFLKTHAAGKPDYSLLGQWTCGINGCKKQLKDVR